MKLVSQDRRCGLSTIGKDERAQGIEMFSYAEGWPLTGNPTDGIT